ncbi:MAG: hypothetical protein KF831_00550 [Acidobacteria bacterium]|nr:hypothetical protein [Acidobacteriota bacterium]
MKKIALILTILALATVSAEAQFRITAPKVNKPKIDKPTPTGSQTNTGSTVLSTPSDRQMVMDDAFTFFDAEHKTNFASSSLKDQDLGWYMKSHLRLMGTFPERSAFRIAVVKNGKQLFSIRCEGTIKTKAKDDRIRSNVIRQQYSLDYDDYMQTNLQCFNKDETTKETGVMNVEVYFINGDTDEEKLVRTYKIDVRRATKVRGNALKPEQDVPSYYIQRHAETAVAFAYFDFGDRNRNGYFRDPVERSNYSGKLRTLRIYSTFSPESGKYLPNKMFTRCTVNGQRIDFTNNLDRDSVQDAKGGRSDEVGTYIDRLTPQYQRGNPYVDKVVFRDLVFEMPIYTGEDKSTLDEVKIEDNPGKWECNIIANGETLRTYRWTAANGKIVPHAEQASGNVNLFYDAAMIEMEIPAGGASFDYRLTPMPEMGLFYGIPWKTAEGKALATRVPKKGNPFHVPSTQAK